MSKSRVLVSLFFEGHGLREQNRLTSENSLPSFLVNGWHLFGVQELKCQEADKEEDTQNAQFSRRF